jgi:probable HAF family extracellular repeat protein
VTGYSYLSTKIQVTCPPRQYDQQKKCYIHPYHAFLYSNGTMNDLGTLGGNNSQGLGINLSGEVVGPSDTKTGSSSFLWNGKTMTDLSPMGAYAINDSGQMAGVCGNNPGTQACLDSNGTITLLPDPSNFTPHQLRGQRDQRQRPDRRQRHRHRHQPDPRPAADPDLTTPSQCG